MSPHRRKLGVTWPPVVILLLASAGSGCFGSRFRRAGEFERARKVAVGQAIGLSVMAGSALWMQQLKSESEAILASICFLTGFAGALGAELKDYDAMRLRQFQELSPEDAVRWRRMSALGYGLIALGVGVANLDLDDPAYRMTGGGIILAGGTLLWLYRPSLWGQSIEAELLVGPGGAALVCRF